MSDNIKVRKLTVPPEITPPCCSCGNHSDYYVKLGSREVHICKRGLAELMNEIVSCCLIGMEEDKDK